MAPFHLGMFYESQDPAGALVNIAALAEDILFTDGDNLRVPRDMTNVVLLAAGVPSGGDGFVRLDAPSFEPSFSEFIRPVNGNADADAEPGSPPAVLDRRGNPLIMVGDDQLQALTDYDTTSGQVAFLGLWFADGPIEPLGLGGALGGAPMRTMRATNGSTLTADVWTVGALTFDANLPAGRYAVVGLRAQSAGLVACRLLFPNQAARPGVLGCDADADLDWPGFRHGGMGIFGEFEHTNPPRAEFLSVSGDSAQEVFLDLVQVRSGIAA